MSGATTTTRHGDLIGAGLILLLTAPAPTVEWLPPERRSTPAPSRAPMAGSCGIRSSWRTRWRAASCWARYSTTSALRPLCSPGISACASQFSYLFAGNSVALVLGGAISNWLLGQGGRPVASC